MAKVFIDGRRDGYIPDQCGKTMTMGELISYLEDFDEDAKVYLKNDNGYTVLAETPCAIRMGEKLTIAVSVRGSHIEARCAGTSVSCEDTDRPYLEGEVGVAVREGSAALVERIRVKGV